MKKTYTELTLPPSEATPETDILSAVLGSTPPRATKKTAFPVQFKALFGSETELWQSVAQKYPYKKARLVHHDFNLKKRWYVIFYAYNVATEKLERKRIFDPINRKKTVAKRLESARDIITQVNEELKAGKVLGKGSLKKISRSNKENIRAKTWLQCLEFFVQQKRKERKRETYLRRFEGHIYNHIKNFLEVNNLEDPNIRQVDEDLLEDFFDYVRPFCKSNKTYNNYRDDLSIVFNYLNSYRKEEPIWKHNPVHAIGKMRTVAKKHAAFSPDQVQNIIKAAQLKGWGQFVLFVRFMFYTLARPIELLSLRVRDIDLKHSRIIFRGDESKNWRDEYVTINPAFKKHIDESGILNANPDDYVFSPGPKKIRIAKKDELNTEKNLARDRSAYPYSVRHIDEDYFGKRINIVLKELGYKDVNPNYSLYSLKHSGAIDLWLETKDIYAVKEQCRHTDISQTDQYLRDLGLLRKSDPVMNYHGSV